VTWPTAPPPTSTRHADDKVEARLRRLGGTVARLARVLLRHGRALTTKIDELEAETTELVKHLAPSLLVSCGCGPLTAAKILGETAGVNRFRSKQAYARHTGTAHCRFGHPTGRATVCPAPATGNATQRCTASP
jgi:transposase